MKEFKELDFDKFYMKALDAFKEYLYNDDRKEYEDEANVSLDKIVTKEEWVKVWFQENDHEHFIIETRLRLFAPDGEEIGWYCYHEYENGEVEDDYLVFD